jgi:hypothetical protein
MVLRILIWSTHLVFFFLSLSSLLFQLTSSGSVSQCHPPPPITVKHSSIVATHNHRSRKVNLRNLSGHSLSPSYLQWTCLYHHFPPSSSFISYTKQIAKLSSSSLELFLFKDHFRPPRHRILKTNVRFHLIYETHQFIL